MLEKGLITYCAPTLAGLKSANLFNYRIQTPRKEILREVYEVNRKLNARGVRIEPLLWKDTFVLIYVYRPRLLARDLYKEGVAQLLMEYGYEECEVDSCLVRLRNRLSQEEGFPHEIGVFLGYPLPDVIGFINHKGQDCKCCGIWKVYCDEDEARKQFCRMEKCTQVYQQVFAKGRTIEQMTVNAS